MDIKMANRLYELRKANNLSQEELAEKIGVSRQAVSKWERSESSPDIDNLIELAKIYNISLDELINGDDVISGNDIKKESSEQISLTDDEGQTVLIKDGSVKFINPDGTEEKIDKKKLAIKSAIMGSITLLLVIIFLVLGFTTKKWYVDWVVLLNIPILGSVVEGIFKKKITEFAYPILISAIYLFIGLEYKMWHPWWWIFITIPVFYMIFEPVDKYVLKSIDESDK